MKRRESALRLVGLGWFIAICIVGGLLLGLWLDGKFGTRPWLTLVGIIAGLVLAIYGAYRMILPNLRKDGK